MENNIESKKVFSNIWSNVYKIIGGETRFKDKFEFIEGTEETARRTDNKITVEFVNFNNLGINGNSADGYIYGQTGYLRGKPKLVMLMKVEECDERLYSDLIHNYAHEMVHVASRHCQKELNSTNGNNRNEFTF